MGAAVDIPNTGLPPWSGNACLPCIHNHLGILVLAIALDWPNGDEHQSIWSAFSVFGGYCPSSRNIFQAGRALSKLGEHCLCLEDNVQAVEDIIQAVRILKQLESNFLPTPATQIEPSMATGWREIRIKGIQVKNMNFVCKKHFFRERSLLFK